MTAIGRFNAPYALCWSSSSAVSPEAGLVSANLTEALRSHLQSAVFNSARLSALSALEDFYKIAANENWDGEGALAVDRGAYANAQLFISLLPSGWTKPEISGDPDGEVAVEWESGPRRRLSVSIGSDDTISYAWLNGSERGHGTDIFIDEIPAGFAAQVNRVAQS